MSKSLFFFLYFEENFVPPLMRANISTWLAILLAWVQQNTAYVIMQIYLFIVRNHATEPNMPFFCPERQGKRRKKKKRRRRSDRCRCHAEPEGMLLRMSHSVRSYQQGLALRQPLPPHPHPTLSLSSTEIRGVSSEHSSWSWHFSPASYASAHRGAKRTSRKQP